MNDPYIQIFNGNGFQMKFSNGWKISVMCSERHYAGSVTELLGMGGNSSIIAKTAEVAIINPFGEFAKMESSREEDDDIMRFVKRSEGWTHPDTIAKIIEWVSLQNAKVSEPI